MPGRSAKDETKKLNREVKSVKVLNGKTIVYPLFCCAGFGCGGPRVQE